MRRLVGVLVGSVLIGCTQDAQRTVRRPATESATVKPRAEDLPVFPVDSATIAIEGVVVFEGEPPEQRRIKMSEEYCRSLYAPHTGPVEPAVEVRAGRRVPPCCVSVADLDRRWRFPPPAQPRVVIKAKGCMFEPRVVGVQVGQTVAFVERDATTHNWHWMGKLNRDQRGSLPRVGGPEPLLLTTPEVAFVKCDIHDWEKSWVHVLPHPILATTDGEGRFRLPPLPPGDYDVSVWHERFRGEAQRVTLRESDALDREPLILRVREPG